MRKTQKKLTRKRKHDNDEETHTNDNFQQNIKSISFKKETDVNLLVMHLEEHLSHEIKSDLERMVENIPKIRKTFDTIYNFVQILEKTLPQVPRYKMKRHKSGKFAVRDAPLIVYLTGTSQTQQVDQHGKNEQQ